MKLPQISDSKVIIATLTAAFLVLRALLFGYPRIHVNTLDKQIYDYVTKH